MNIRVFLCKSSNDVPTVARLSYFVVGVRIEDFELLAGGLGALLQSDAVPA